MMPEFASPVLESLRQPLESGEAVVARVNAHVRYPARVQLIAAMNPCKCGYLADPAQCCSRAPRCGLDYQARLSGPLLDRIDIQLEMPAVSAADLALPPPKEGSAEAAARVRMARERQAERFAELDPSRSIRLNAAADGEVLDQAADLSPKAAALMARAADQLRLSARGYRRILRVARTIADLAGAASVEEAHVAEAASYRRAPLVR